MTAQIVDCIQRVLEPAGVAILVDAKHQCMTTRGIKKPDVATITRSLPGFSLKTRVWKPASLP